mmetsp:Transcript_11002/g.34768  ORF Transcript_11002/g.34768 Transcript_11002/m.34768 type:complete len:84 (-) Transcript_11002:26-277(-)
MIRSSAATNSSSSSTRLRFAARVSCASRAAEARATSVRWNDDAEDSRHSPILDRHLEGVDPVGWGGKRERVEGSLDPPMVRHI